MSNLSGVLNVKTAKNSNKNLIKDHQVSLSLTSREALSS
jgi:hypothetical protein